MGEQFLVICEDTKEIEWVDRDEVTSWVNDHYPHAARIIKPDAFEDDEATILVLRELLHWQEEKAE